MNPFFQYISEQLAEKLNRRRIVVWYDGRQEFVGFIHELRGGPIDGCKLVPLKLCAGEGLGELTASLCCYAGSLFEVKHVADPIMASDDPDPLLVYLPGVTRDDVTNNVLLEFDRAGIGVEWKMAQLAHLCLRDHFSLDRVDQILAGKVSYADVASILKDTGQGGRDSGSILRAIFEEARTDAERLAAWLATAEKDEAILTKGGRGEIERLVGKAGGKTDAEADLAGLRLNTVRHILVGEFVLDLHGERPPSVAMVKPPRNAEQEKFLRQTAQALRDLHGDTYVVLADQVEHEFQLAGKVPAELLGSIDTFRFEEQALLKHAGGLLTGKRFGDARAIVESHARSFWADRDARRQQQWEACRRMAALGISTDEVRAELPKPGAAVEKWLEGYSEPEGWYRVDMQYRQLESHLASMTDVPDSETACTTVIQQYEHLLDAMAKGFMASFKAAGWEMPSGSLRQTQVFSEFVGSRPARDDLTVLVLADSLRYEMGVELARLMDDADELVLKPAIAAIPTITPIGMAALLPGADASFDVVETGGKIGGRIDGKTLPGLKERLAFLKASHAGTKDVALDDLLAMSASQLRSRVKDTTLLVVRAQDIDQLGETGKGNLARQVMDTAVSNIARGVRKLAHAGASRFIIAADHGHILGRDKEESMRIESPGGATVDLHRRCWVGRGGTSPPETVRLSGQDLGYASDLDFVFPTGIGVFKAGGDLGYHHGGLSLQELIVPVLVVELATATAASPELTVEVKDLPRKISNRTFRITVSVTGSLFGQGQVCLRPSLVANGLQVGEAGMVLDGTLDPTTKCVSITPGTTCTIMMMLQREGAQSLRLLVEDAGSGAVLYQSPSEIPVDVM